MDEKNTPKMGHEDHAVPFDLFDVWFKEAKNKEKPYPDAMTLATADARGRPSARIVLLKDFDQRGFVFYTNYESRKGDQLAENSFAALCFHWKSLEKCARIEGAVTKVESVESDEYFASRPRGSQLGAWASTQSRPMSGRFDLEKRVAEFTRQIRAGQSTSPGALGGLPPDS